VNHRATPRFWFCYRKLPGEIQQFADRNFELLLSNPRHPSLRFKKVGPYWSVRIGLQFGALAVEDNSVLLWFWIGPHDEYEQVITGHRG
jgi:hypothetical protein